MDHRMAYNIQKDLLKAILDGKADDWYISEGIDIISVIQKCWLAFIPKKAFFIDYEKVKEVKGYTELFLNTFTMEMKIPLRYITSRDIKIGKSGRMKKILVFDDISGKKTFIDNSLLKYLPKDIIFEVVKIKESELIYILDAETVIMVIMPIKLNMEEEATINI